MNILLTVFGWMSVFSGITTIIVAMIGNNKDVYPVLQFLVGVATIVTALRALGILHV